MSADGRIATRAPKVRLLTFCVGSVESRNRYASRRFGDRLDHHADREQAAVRTFRNEQVDISNARKEAIDSSRKFSGFIRIVRNPVSSAYATLAICDFIEWSPPVEVELKPSDRAADFFDDDLDAAVRIRNLADSAFKVRRIGKIRVVVFGSPAFRVTGGRIILT